MEHLTAHIVPLCLVAFRLSGLFVFAPVLASLIIPGKVKALLVFMLAALIYPTLPASSIPAVELDVVSLAVAVTGEVIIGLFIGLLALMPVLAVQLGAAVMGQQMGFGMAAVYNPALETESDVIGELMLYIALGLFVGLGGFELLFNAVATSFLSVPLGGFSANTLSKDLFIGVLTSGFDLALRVATPVLAIIFIETIASGFITKTMPQLNVMSLGFGIKVMLGLIAMIAGLAAMHEAMRGHMLEVSEQIMQWASGRLGHS